MSYFQMYTIAMQGMNLEKLRVDTVANNIAHQHSLAGKNGSGFQPMQVIARAKPFDSWLHNPEKTRLDAISLIPQNLPAQKIWQPGHPAADKQGYISSPGISMIDEMTTLLRASRAYEANLKIINTAHSLYMHTLTIGEER